MSRDQGIIQSLWCILWIWSSNTLLCLSLIISSRRLCLWKFVMISIRYVMLIFNKQYHLYVSYTTYIFLFAVYDLDVMPLDFVWIICLEFVRHNVRGPPDQTGECLPIGPESKMCKLLCRALDGVERVRPIGRSSEQRQSMSWFAK